MLFLALHFVRFLYAATALTAATPSAYMAPGNDWLVIPGVRAGPITARTRRSDLVRLFGPANVKDGDVGVGDAIGAGTIVLFDRPEMSFQVEWADPAMKTRIYSLHFCPDRTVHSCRWHTQEGIRKGTTLRTLEKLNARDFVLLGFEWDFEGTVVSWRGGKMEKTSGGCLGLQLLPGVGASVSQEITGDHEILSSSPVMQTAKPTVSLMSLAFECSRK